MNWYNVSYFFGLLGATNAVYGVYTAFFIETRGTDKETQA